MLKWIESTGKNEEDAIQKALQQLSMDRDDVSVEILERAKSGFLGIGSVPAKVKVSYEVPDPVVEPVKKVEPVKQVAVPPKVVAPAPKAEPKPEPKAVPVVKATPVESRPKPASKREEPRAKKPKQVAPVPVAPKTKDTEAQFVRSVPAEDDQQVLRMYEFLGGLMERMEVTATPKIMVRGDGTYEVEMVGQNLGGLIGRRGETLDAIQQLTNYAVNRGQVKRVRIHIDAEGYRAKREDALKRMAEKTAAKVVKYRRNMTLEPMNAYERHVVHAALQEYPNVSTFSTGSEPNRRTVVAYSRGGER